MRKADAVSSGGVMYRNNGARVQVVLVGRSTQGSWGLPKGTPDEGETFEQTALREVREETGLIPRIEESLGSIQYYFVARGTRFHKIVHFFLMHAIGGDLADHDQEYDLVEWFDIDDAALRLSYPNEAEIVQRARERLFKLPTDVPA